MIQELLRAIQRTRHHEFLFARLLLLVVSLPLGELTHMALDELLCDVALINLVHVHVVLHLLHHE